MAYKPYEQDYRFWLVVNPAVWLMPILLTVFVIALFIHGYAFTLKGQAWTNHKAAAPVAVEAPAAK